MSVKHFDEYFKRYSDHYNEIVETSKEFAKLVEQGEIPKERIEAFMASSKPVADTFFVLKKVKDLLDIPEDFENDNEEAQTVLSDMDAIETDGKNNTESCNKIYAEFKGIVGVEDDTADNN